MDLEAFLENMEISSKLQLSKKDDLALKDFTPRSQDIYSFHQLYETICDRLRSTKVVEKVKEEFEDLPSDYQRVLYVWELEEIKHLRIIESTKVKNNDLSEKSEVTYDTMIPEEVMAQHALNEIHRSIKFTSSNDEISLARRYGKRAWANLLLENFQDAEVDAKRSLSFDKKFASEWNVYEILGHCCAKKEEFKKSEGHFKLAIQMLRDSESSQSMKAMTASRIAAVFKNIKGKKDVKKKKSKRLDSENDEPKLPLVSYNQHRTLSNASDAVCLVSNQLRGRSLYASKQIEPGDILIVESPFAASLSSECFQTHCCTCFKRLLSTCVPCFQCSEVWFCNEECREETSNFHKEECSILHLLEDQSISKMSTLVLRILMKEKWCNLKEKRDKYMKILDKTSIFKNETSIPAQYDCKSYQTIFNLVSNDEKRSFGDLFQRSIMAVFLASILKKINFCDTDDDRNYVSSLILHHLQGSSCNAYGIEELSLEVGESFEIGGAIYPTISLSNHSCWPNTVRYSVGKSCVLRATRTINKGSEIFDNYGPNYLTDELEDRQTLLRSQYKFNCDCIACAENWSKFPHGDDTLTVLCPAQNCRQPARLFKRKVQCNICGDMQGFKELSKECDARISQFNQSLKLLSTNNEAAIKGLNDLQKFLDSKCVPPGKLYSDCQEAIKRSFNLQGNVYKCHSQN